jgi:ADP-dependent NAD(P)H-hydrate dehydratase / NAD(P)H-hydrate epimerase
MTKPLKKGVKVVTVNEIVQMEKFAFTLGVSEEKLMESAGQKVAAAVLQLLKERRTPKKVTLLIGKGNNGGDAYVAGCVLLDAGCSVQAYTIAPRRECSLLNQKYSALYRRKGGVEEKIAASAHFDEIIIDGLLGTGFRGNLAGPLQLAIEMANRSGKPILSIDIPSGVNGTTGETGGCAIEAQWTIALGLPKIGCFLRDGWNFTGELVVEDIGFPIAALEKAHPIAYLPDFSEVQLPKIKRNRHKYQAGYLLGLGGSDTYKGAMKLAGMAALRSGAGIVRIFHRGNIGEAPVELICQKWDEKKWRQELERASALCIGPGLGEAPSWLGTISIPCVIDADALEAKATYPEGAILTPHRGEALRLLGLKKNISEEELFKKLKEFCQKRRVVVILKGAPTFLFGIEEVPLIYLGGSPGMATASSGDVLTGIIAALLSQGVKAIEAALLGVALHGLAGEIAASEKSSYSLIASDLIDYLPRAFNHLLKEKKWD